MAPEAQAAGTVAGLAPLPKGREMLATFLSLMPDSAVAVDRKGTIVALNERTEIFFGYAASELEGKSIEILVPERFRHSHRSRRAAYSSAPRARPMGAGLDLYARRKDGSEFPVDISLAPVASEEGQLVVAAVRDITERKAAQAAAAQLAAIVESSADGIFSMSDRGVITSWNPGAEAIFGFSRTDVVGHHVGLYFPDDPVLEELLDSALRARFAVAETRWPTSDGTMIDVAVSISTLAVGNETGFSVVVRDISELASVRSERDRLLISADRERIARDLHDLVIQRLFGAGLRLQGALGLIDNQPAVARVSSTIDDLDTTIKEIREAIFALESTPGTGLKARVLEAVTDATEGLGFKPTVFFRGLTDREIALPVQLEATAVLREALSNSARHAHAGRVEVHVTVGDELGVLVVDNGVGVGKPRRMSGIANARARAELLGGHLDLLPAEGGGTRFDWRVPIVIAATGAPKGKSSPSR
ncbi:MAG TPA: PAS domain S-box protein [Acidimicrobiales bacterium]|nr:PAS domain S-box protein [Acidimicrobiales bacterium]